MEYVKTFENFFKNIKTFFENPHPEKSEEDEWKQIEDYLHRMLYDINNYNSCISIIKKHNGRMYDINKKTIKEFEKYTDYSFIVKKGDIYQLDISLFMKKPTNEFVILDKEGLKKSLIYFSQYYKEHTDRLKGITRPDGSTPMFNSPFVKDPIIDDKVDQVFRDINQ